MCEENSVTCRPDRTGLTHPPYNALTRSSSSGEKLDVIKGLERKEGRTEEKNFEICL